MSSGAIIAQPIATALTPFTWSTTGTSILYEPDITYASHTGYISTSAAGNVAQWLFLDPGNLPSNVAISKVRLEFGCSTDPLGHGGLVLLVDSVETGAITGDAPISFFRDLATNPVTGVAWRLSEVFGTPFGIKSKDVGSGVNSTFHVRRGILYLYFTDNLTFTPPSVSTLGGTAITLSGSEAEFNYVGSDTPGAVLKTSVFTELSGDAFTNVTKTSLTSLTAVAPAHAAGTFSVEVFVADADGAPRREYFPTIIYETATWYKLQTATARTSHYPFLDTSTAATNDFRVFDENAPYAYSTDVFWYEFDIDFNIPDDWVTGAEPDHHGWYWSADDFSGGATLTVGGVPKNPRSFDEVATFTAGAAAYLGGFPGCGVSLNNRLIYAADSYTVGTDAPPIRLFDGTSDRELIRVPKTAALVLPKAIMSMIATNGTIYLSTYDSGTTSADWAGRIFILDPQDTTLIPLGDDVFTAGQLPYAIAWYNGSLWVGTHRQDGAQVGRLYRIRPGQETTWTLDHTFSAGEGCVASLASFQGSLYCGMTNAAGTFAKVFARDSLGAFTTADTGTGGTATAGNGYPYLYVFGTNLYASFWNNDTPKIAKIRKFDGTSWTTAYTGAAGTLTPFIGMFEDSGYLFALGGGLLLQAALLRTTNGSSWTDLSAFLPGTATLIPCFGSLVL